MLRVGHFGGLRQIFAAVIAVMVLAGCGQQTPTPSASPSPEPTSPYRQPKTQFLTMLAECMTAGGWVAVFDPATEAINVEGITSPGDQGAVEAVREDCARRIDPLRVDPPPELTDGQWRQRYTYLLAQVECLRELGHDVPPPPDFASWRQSDAAWDPYGTLIERGRPAPNYHVLTCQNVEERPAFIDW